MAKFDLYPDPSDHISNDAEDRQVKTFQYYQIRCCVSDAGHTMSFLGDPSPLQAQEPSALSHTKCGAYNEADAYRRASGSDAAEIFWTLYGIEEDGCALAIGDFVSFEAAYEILCAILAPIRAAADLFAAMTPHVYSADGGMIEETQGLASALEDICNQSTTEERL